MPHRAGLASDFRETLLRLVEAVLDQTPRMPLELPAYVFEPIIVSPYGTIRDYKVHFFDG